MRVLLDKQAAIDLYESGQLVWVREQCVHCGSISTREGEDRANEFYIYSYWSIEDGKCRKCGATDHPVAPQVAWFDAVAKREFILIEKKPAPSKSSLALFEAVSDNWVADTGPVEMKPAKQPTGDHFHVVAVLIFAMFLAFMVIISRG